MQNRFARLPFLVLLALMLTALPACQSVDGDVESITEPYTVVDEMPKMAGGLAALQQEIKYPELASKAGIEGRVILSFVVDTDGSVRDVEVVQGIGGGCDEEATRALMAMRFEPGRQDGQPVPVELKLPVTFKRAADGEPAQSASSVDTMPEMVGGMAALQQEIKYPEVAHKAGIEGRVVVSFVVGTDGSVQYAKVEKGIGGGCDEEALRAVQAMRFEPGMQDGKAVPVELKLPVTFKRS